MNLSSQDLEEKIISAKLIKGQWQALVDGIPTNTCNVSTKSKNNPNINYPFCGGNNYSGTSNCETNYKVDSTTTKNFTCKNGILSSTDTTESFLCSNNEQTTLPPMFLTSSGLLQCQNSSGKTGTCIKGSCSEPNGCASPCSCYYGGVYDNTTGESDPGLMCSTVNCLNRIDPTAGYDCDSSGCKCNKASMGPYCGYTNCGYFDKKDNQSNEWMLSTCYTTNDTSTGEKTLTNNCGIYENGDETPCSIYITADTVKPNSGDSCTCRAGVKRGSRLFDPSPYKDVPYPIKEDDKLSSSPPASSPAPAPEAPPPRRRWTDIADIKLGQDIKTNDPYLAKKYKHADDLCKNGGSDNARTHDNMRLRYTLFNCMRDCPPGQICRFKPLMGTIMNNSRGKFVRNRYIPTTGQSESEYEWMERLIPGDNVFPGDTQTNNQFIDNITNWDGAFTGTCHFCNLDVSKDEIIPNPKNIKEISDTSYIYKYPQHYDVSSGTENIPTFETGKWLPPNVIPKDFCTNSPSPSPSPPSFTLQSSKSSSSSPYVSSSSSLGFSPFNF